MDREPQESSGNRPVLALVVPATLGDRLRSWRVKNRKTQAQFAEMFDVRPQTISAWERGKDPQRRFFGQIAELLELPGPQSVEVLLKVANERATEAEVTEESLPASPAGSKHPALTELQESVVRAITRQLANGLVPSRRQMALFDRLFAAVGLDSPEVSGSQSGGSSDSELKPTQQDEQLPAERS